MRHSTASIESAQGRHVTDSPPTSTLGSTAFASLISTPAAKAAAQSSMTVPDLPTFDSSAFGGEDVSFYFDMVRLQDRRDIPRAFAHRHNYYHLLWMTQAKGVHMLDFVPHPVEPCTVFFVSPAQIHSWTSSVPPRGYVMNISADLFLQMFPRADQAAQFPFFDVASGQPALYLTADQHDALLPLVEAIEAEYLGDADGRLDIVRSYLLILLTRLRRLAPPQAPVEGVSPQGLSLLRRYQQQVEQHFMDGLAVPVYASQLHVTERQLNDAVKRATGRTAGQVIQQRVLLEAKRLLTLTDLGIAEVAYRLGYDDLAYFCRFFKRHTQVTPGDFRKRHARPEETSA